MSRLSVFRLTHRLTSVSTMHRKEVSSATRYSVLGQHNRGSSQTEVGQRDTNHFMPSHHSLQVDVASPRRVFVKKAQISCSLARNLFVSGYKIRYRSVVENFILEECYPLNVP